MINIKIKIMENPKLYETEEKIIYLSEQIEKLLNILMNSLEGKDVNNYINSIEDLKYKEELENYKEDNNPKINLATYIFNLIDKIKMDINKSIDIIYS